MLFTLPDHTADKHLFLGTGAKPRTIHSKPNENCTAGTNSHTWVNIKQLLDEVFVISRIIKVEVRVISRSRRLRLITLTETLIILDITKTESNNCFIIH